MQLEFNAEKEVPPGVSGWNWGAFIFTWIWGIFNNTWISLLCLFPPAHLIMMFVLGAKGNEWAWRNKDWPSVEAFHRTQRKWAVWGVGGFFGVIGFFVAIVACKISTMQPEVKSMLNDFNPHRRFCNYALETAERNERCYRTLGAPLRVHGRVEYVRGHSGYSEVSIPVSGPRGTGTMYLRMRQHGNSTTHNLENAEVDVSGEGRIPLNTESILRGGEPQERGVQLSEASHAKAKWESREPKGMSEAEEFYRESLQRAESDATVRQVLGNQIAAQVVNANVDMHGSIGTADFNVVLRGNGTRGLLDLKGERSMGRWTFNGGQVALETNSGIKVVQFPPAQ